MATPSLLDRFRGCLLGLAIGDALGGRFEARSAQSIRERFPTPEALIAYPQDEIWYTDDTQMAIGVAEMLVERGEIVESRLCEIFAANYVPSRGYGRGARAVLEAMEEGRDYKQIAEEYFPGGSYGNGAAMRVAPVGLLFRDSPERIRGQAFMSAILTHVHPAGMEGAYILALAVALASSLAEFDRDRFFKPLIDRCAWPQFKTRMEQASRAESVDDLACLGNGIEAIESVPTAIAGFAISPNSYTQTIGQVILLGGDTDTLAAMAGAISGAFLGVQGIPPRLIELLESSPKGREYIIGLAERLHEVY